MNELATQAANGTNAESDRQSIQDEIDQLTTEIDRVSETTKFNETYLLKGTKGTQKNYLAGHDAGITGTFVDSATTATLTVNLSVGKSVTIAGTTYNITDSATKGLNATQRSALNGNAADGLTKLQTDANGAASVTLNGTTYTKTTDNNNQTVYDAGTGTTYSAEELIAKIEDGTTVQIGTADAVIARDYTKETNIDVTDATDKIITALKQANNIGITADADGTTTYSSVANANNSNYTAKTKENIDFTITKGTATVAKDLSFNLHVGADADMTNKIGVKISSMSAAGLGVSDLNVADDSGVAATYAIDAIADAIATVSAQRSALGAVQNRLEHTINNLDNVVENTTSAESRIRDTDMAEEMVEYSKNNILAQAGQSMLAQANSANQGVLSLLG
jgi:flagellin